ncbi:MAG: ParA family protein [Desulfurobacterium sp.]|nr:MAG: ParA family protein [Desulfurobacterium sp.]
MIITVAHQKGGVGKSTIAVNLAVEMQLPIVDLDSQNSCYLFSKIREKEQRKSLQVFTPETLEEIKEILRNTDHRKLIIDSGGYDNDLNRFALIASDLVVTPVSPSQIEIFGLQKFAQIIEKAKEYRPDLKVYILINNADARSMSEIIELEKFIQTVPLFRILSSRIFRRVDYKRAYQQGLSVCEYKPDSKACREVKRLIREIDSLHVDSI